MKTLWLNSPLVPFYMPWKWKEWNQTFYYANPVSFYKWTGLFSGDIFKSHKFQFWIQGSLRHFSPVRVCVQSLTEEFNPPSQASCHLTSTAVFYLLHQQVCSRINFFFSLLDLILCLSVSIPYIFIKYWPLCKWLKFSYFTTGGCS